MIKTMMMNTIISLFVYLLIDSDYDDSYCVRVSGHVGVCVCVCLSLFATYYYCASFSVSVGGIGVWGFGVSMVKVLGFGSR